jgi:hypothetical protein
MNLASGSKEPLELVPRWLDMSDVSDEAFAAAYPSFV